MIQTDDLDKPLAERCDQYGHLVEVTRLQHHSLSVLIILFYILEKEKRSKTKRYRNSKGPSC